MAERRPDRTLGGPNDAFWASCAKGELRLQRCADCARYSWPPVESCEHCQSGALSWEPMSGKGSIAGWCSFEQDYYGGILPVPYDTILVELEEGPLFLSNPDDFTWRDIKPGMAVELRFRECEDSAGGFSLPVFAKA